MKRCERLLTFFCQREHTVRDEYRILNVELRTSKFLVRYSLFFSVLCGFLALPRAAGQTECSPNIYVPYADLAELIEPTHKAVLMDRAEFERLLAAAEANAQAADLPAIRLAGKLQLGQVKNAQYVAEVAGEQLTLTGDLEVVSMSDGPVAVPLGFAQIGLTQVALDGSPAPLGYDRQGRLTLTVTAKGSHKLGICGTAKLKELSSGGTQFSISLPEAVAGTMKLAAAGDLDMHATVPISQSSYDRQADRTTAELTVGGQDKLTVVLLGNGRQADERAILLGESASTVNLTGSHQILSCLYTVQILRRGVRELEFELPAEWTVTEITCPSLVQWSVGAAEQAHGIERDPAPRESRIKVRLRGGRVGSVALHIKATAPQRGSSWRSPGLVLVDAVYQRGYMVVNTDEGLRVRGEKLICARREDMPTTTFVPGLLGGPGGRLYFHWGDNWSVDLELATAVSSRSVKERQKVVVSPEQVILTGEFEVTAIERELFEMSFVIGPPAFLRKQEGPQWQINTVQVNQRQTSGTGLQPVKKDGQDGRATYRIEQHGDKCRLIVELPQPIQPEKVLNVRVELRHVPPNWHWPSGASARTISVPAIESEAQSVSGQVSISATGDLEAQPQKVPDCLEVVPVGRMALLGIAKDVRYAYSYNTAVAGQMELEVSRRRPRVSAEAVGLIAVRPHEFTGDWRITYAVSRASAERLYVLADKSLGQNIKITSPTVTISSAVRRPVEKSVVPSTPLGAGPSAEFTLSAAEGLRAGQEIRQDQQDNPDNPVNPVKKEQARAADSQGMTLRPDAAEKYDLWLLNLDRNVTGAVVVDIHYERPVTQSTGRLTADSLLIPLVRPICEGQINEHLAVQASEELALGIEAGGAKEIDAIDLPPLPAAASRILAAFRLDAAGTETGAKAMVKLQMSVHSNYEILSALASSAELTTYLDVQGGQRTQAHLRLANAGKQFLTMRLPDGAELWSLRVDDAQAKPQRSAARDYQVPLGQLGRQVDVRIVYAYQPAAAGQPTGMDLRRVELGGVELPALALNTVRWTVIPPPGYRITTQETKMQTNDIVIPKAAYLRVCDFLAKNMFAGSLLMQPLGKEYRAGKGVALSRLRFSRQADEVGQMVQEAVESYVPKAPPRPSDMPVQTAEPQQKYAGVRLVEQGRVTLPVDLVPTAGAGPSVTFSGLGAAKLIVGLSSQSRQENWWGMGFALGIIVGLTAVRKKAKTQIGLIVAELSITSLAAIWWPGTTYLANGAFMAGICLMPLYVLTCVGLRLPPFLPPAGGTGGAAMLLIWLFCIGSSTGPTLAADTRNTQIQSVIPPQSDVAAGVIIPYDGDPTGIKDSEKILVPYSRYVELWNRAHPEDPIDGPKPGTDICLAAVRYRLTVQAEPRPALGGALAEGQSELVLTADVTTYGKGWVVLGLPISGLAVTSATLAGKPAQLQSGPKGMVLMLPGGVCGRLEIKAVMTPQYQGLRGSVNFSLPPLPAAVMDVILPDEDLELEVDDIEGTLARFTRQTYGGQGLNGKVQWTFGLGLTRSLALRWLPKLGGGVADSTLSANCVHDVYAFHWALVGVTKIAYSFSGGQHDRFTALLPADCVLTELKGTNIRDYRELGEATIENMTFKIVEARLYRPAKKQYELTVRWLAALPPALSEGSRPAGSQVEGTGQKPTRLPLIRAGDVSRESGTVTLHAAGGMTIKTTHVSGGRRVDLGVNPDPGDGPPPRLLPARRMAGESGDAGAGQLTRPTYGGLSSDRAEAVASYYWPYRPFELYVELARLAPSLSGQAHLDQLVRVAADRVELLVQASLKVERGKMFGASFALPSGYELLSVVGAAVESFYQPLRLRSGQGSNQPPFLVSQESRGALAAEQSTFVHIKFHRGQQEAKIALVLVCREVHLEDFGVPTITYIDAVGVAAPSQQGRVAVQLAASFEAKTLSSENAKAISPQTLNDWLDSRQIDSVRYAYSYDGPPPAFLRKQEGGLRLNIIRLPTQIRLECFAGLVVRVTAAVYTYRLRYNIAGSPIDQLSFDLPTEYAPLVMVESPALRNVTQSDAGDGQTRWTVTLVDEVTGVVDVTVNFALPIEASTNALTIPPLRASAPAASRSRSEPAGGYQAIVAVQNMSRHDISVKDKVNLAELATSEQQKLMPREMRESLQYVFQSFSRSGMPQAEQDWSLRLDLKPAKTAARIQAVVDLMALTTVIDRGGHCRYEARLSLQNRSEQFLRVKLPPGLRLWSAHVAGQAVKPASLRDGEVLIPLVKTSPGGLPYDVLLYFADEGARPLVAPFNGITKLSPPAISIVGIPVTRTTWSLHLPAGYRYLRPGGNMSAVVGPVEVSSLGIQARLEQLERLERTYRDVAGTVSQKEVVAQTNWEAFNKKLAEDISRVESDTDAYRDKVSDSDFRRLKSMLGEQKSRADVLISGNAAFIQRQQEQARNDMNSFLNASSSNAGVAEVIRNNAMFEMPGFVGENERQQIARLQEELQVTEQQLQAAKAEQAPEQETPMDDTRKDLAKKVGGKAAKDVVAEYADKESEIGKILGELSREGAAKIDQQQAQLRGQLGELVDNRLRRHFQAGQDMKQAAKKPPLRGAGAVTDSFEESRGGYGGMGRQPSIQQPAQTEAPRLEFMERLEPAVPAAPGAVATYGPAPGERATELYVARAVYSLPVTLPQGEVRLDFARPGGEVQISLWVVPTSTLRNLYQTLTVLAAVLLAMGLVRVGPRLPPLLRRWIGTRGRPFSAKCIVVYLCVLVLLGLILGLLGLLVGLLVIIANCTIMPVRTTEKPNQ